LRLSTDVDPVDGSDRRRDASTLVRETRLQTGGGPVSEREEWLDWRRGGLGASDIAGVLGLSPWSSPWSVWADKVGLLPDEDDSEVMEFGRYAELMVAPWFEEKTGLRVVCQQERAVDPAASWRRATLDGRVLDAGPGVDLDVDDIDDRTVGLLEMKTASAGRPWLEIPPNYQAQGQWQMLVTGAERVWFAVLMGRRLDVDLVLDRNQADIAFMAHEAERFWTEHVLTGTPPPTDSSDATTRALAAVYPKASPDSVEVDDFADIIAEWQEAKQASKDAEAREKGLANELRAALGDHEEGTLDGQRTISWREQKRAGFDADGFRRDHPRLAKKYATESAFRVLRHHKRKG
jgi:putative phage-type endonuclease